MKPYQAWYGSNVWSVVYLPEAEADLGDLPAAEQAAVRNAVEKLKSLGPRLPYPHSSKVLGAQDLRELRPRAGRSSWRALYRQLGDTFVIAAVGRDAKADSGGFELACGKATQRLAKVEDD